MSYIVKYPEPASSYNIDMIEMWGIFGRAWYPVIKKDGKWVHEFGCCFPDKLTAFAAAEKYVNDLVAKYGN